MSGSDPIGDVYAVVMTMLNGSTVDEINQTYNKCWGKDIDLEKLGFPTLEKLLQSHPERFYHKGNRWFGKQTSSNRELAQVIAAGNSQSGRKQTRTISSGKLRSSSKSKYSFHENEIQRRNLPPNMVTGIENRTNGKPVCVGFGNDSFNYFSSRSSSTNACRTSGNENTMELQPINNSQLSSMYSDRCQKMNAKSFSNVSENADSFLSPPPGLTFGMQRNPQNQFAIDEEYTRKKFSIYNSELAQKIYDLLWSKGCGLSIREISQQLAIPETSSLTPCAQVGIAVKMFPRTFSLSSNNGNGVVDIANGALRPDDKGLGSNDCEIGEIATRNSRRQLDTEKCSVNGDHPFDQFSDPSANNYCGTSSQENCAYKKPSQCFNSGQSNWNDRKWSQSSLVPVNGNEHGYYREQISIPYEPRKFESKQRNVRDFSCLRDYEKGKLTNFVSLDEFYIRRYYDEESYEMMLQELRYDYSGALEKCEPQLWMKGDGAAVWIDRKWQRGVVYAALESHPVYSVSVFLIDEGKMITVSTDRLVPLHHHYYHEAPFAICCSIGQFDVVHKNRTKFIRTCKEIFDCIMESRVGTSEVKVKFLDKIWDEKEKFRVNLIYCGENKVYVPNYFVEEDLIKLRQNY